MTKKLIISAFIVSGLLIIGSLVGVWIWQSDNYKTENQKISQEIANAENQVAEIKAMKDTNGYIPSDVVKNFINEIKNDSVDKAKLYLAKDTQNIDVKTTTGFTKDLDKINIGETSQEVSGDKATVSIDGTWPDDSTPFNKKFTLTKEDNLWKIKEIQEA